MSRRCHAPVSISETRDTTPCPCPMKKILLIAMLLITAPATPAAETSLAERFMHLTRSTVWQPVRQIDVNFGTHHPQGMVKIGDEFFVSSVEILKPTTPYNPVRDGYDRDTGEGRGYLFHFDGEGHLLDTLQLGEGSIYHPGGIDYDGKYIWVPVSEYRPNSQSILYRVDPKTMRAEAVLHFRDHIGGLVHDTERNRLHGVSWGSRRLYTWQLDTNGKVVDGERSPESLRVMNPAQYIDYQDCHYAGSHRMLCGGLNNYKTAPDARPFRLGGLELVDLADNRPVWQEPLSLWAPSGLPMTQNPFFAEKTADGLRFYFMPDDVKSTLFVFDVKTQ